MTPELMSGGGSWEYVGEVAEGECLEDILKENLLRKEEEEEREGEETVPRRGDGAKVSEETDGGEGREGVRVEASESSDWESWND